MLCASTCLLGEGKEISFLWFGKCQTALNNKTTMAQQSFAHGWTVELRCLTHPGLWGSHWFPVDFLSYFSWWLLLTLLHTPKPPSSQSSVLPPDPFFGGSNFISFSAKKSRSSLCEFLLVSTLHLDSFLVWKDVSLLPSKACPLHLSQDLCYLTSLHPQKDSLVLKHF